MIYINLGAMLPNYICLCTVPPVQLLRGWVKGPANICDKSLEICQFGAKQNYLETTTNSTLTKILVYGKKVLLEDNCSNFSSATVFVHQHVTAFYIKLSIFQAVRDTTSDYSLKGCDSGYGR